jgi:hypothetical protein
MLVRGTDRFNHFEHEPAPKSDMAPEAVAFHKFAIARLNNVLMKDAAAPINPR